jgi:hypothetical protein
MLQHSTVLLEYLGQLFNTYVNLSVFVYKFNAALLLLRT